MWTQNKVMMPHSSRTLLYYRRACLTSLRVCTSVDTLDDANVPTFTSFPSEWREERVQAGEGDVDRLFRFMHPQHTNTTHKLKKERTGTCKGPLAFSPQEQNKILMLYLFSLRPRP